MSARAPGPIRFGWGVVAATTLAAGAVLAYAVGVPVGAAVAAAGAACLGGSLRLVRAQPRRVRTVGAAAGLLVVGAGGVVAGGSYATFRLLGALFPVPRVPLFVDPSVRVAGAVVVVAELAVATFGAVVTPGDVLRGKGLRRWQRLGVRTATIPVVAAAALLALGGLRNPGSAVNDAFPGPVGAALDWSAGSPLGTLALLAALGGAVSLVAVWWRRSDRSLAPSRRALAPHAVGGTLVASAALGHGRIVGPLREFAMGLLPTTLGELLDPAVDSVLAFYGGAAVLAGVVAAVTIVGVTAAAALRAARAVGVLPREGAGAALAGGGLVVAAGVASPLGAPAALVVAGVVAGLLAWEMGTFATTLAREAGAAADRRIQLVHLGATLGVGIAGGAAALAGTRLLGGPPTTPGIPVPAALAAVVTGTVLFALSGR